MKNQKAVFQFGNEYNCQSYFNSDLDNGVKVSLNDEHLGTIVGLDIPDISDEDENDYFDEQVINWIVDNGY